MQSWRMREKILDMFEASTGGRVIFSVNRIGGVLKDIPPEMLRDFLKRFDEMSADLHRLTRTFLEDYSVNERLRDVGFLTKEQALSLGAVGPMLRASGVCYDVAQNRLRGVWRFGNRTGHQHHWRQLRRCQVRIGELFQSLDLIRQIGEKMPAGPLRYR